MTKAPLPEAGAPTSLSTSASRRGRLTAMVEDLIADARADAVDISVRSYQLDLGVLVPEVAENNRKLASGKDQELEVAVEPGLRCRGRHGAAARGGRQSDQQRRQIQPPRRPDRGHPGARGRGGSDPRRRSRGRACRRRTATACSAVSSGFPPSRPAAKARPGSACPLPSASSTFTTAASSWKVAARSGGAVVRDSVAAAR